MMNDTTGATQLTCCRSSRNHQYLEPHKSPLQRATTTNLHRTICTRMPLLSGIKNQHSMKESPAPTLQHTCGRGPLPICVYGPHHRLAEDQGVRQCPHDH